MYSYDTRIRYTECANDRKLTLPALVNLFQDCSLFHSEDVGLGLDYLAQSRTAWFLLNWQVVVERMPVFGERVKVCTQPYDFKGFYGSRNFWLEDESGTTIVKAATLWSYMSLETLRPVRPDAAQMARYGTGEKLEMDYAPRKLAVPDNLEACGTIAVRPDMIDTNRHVNNGQYISIAMSLLEQDRSSVKVRQMLAEYKKSAVMGDTFHPYTGWQDGRYYVCLKDDDGNVNVVVVFEADDSEKM